MHSDPLCVLHVDPDPDVSARVETRLRRDWEATVERVGGVDDALAALDDGDYDCVVSEYALPDRDGLALLDAVRERDPDLPFVLFTGEGDERVASEAISAGVTDYVRKAAGEDALAERVDAVVGRGAAGRQAANDGAGGSAAEALVESKRRLRTLISNLPGMVYRATLETPWRMEFVGGNTEFTGYDAEAFESGAVTFGDDLILPADREAVNDAVEDAVRSGDSFEVTYRIRTADGETRHVREQGQPVPVEDPEALEGFIMDITERRRHEERLRRQNERLDEFAATVSHDLRNPLSVAFGRLSMVECDDPNLAKVEDALERMNLLVDDLLTLAREGRSVEEPEPVDLAPLVRECWAATNASAATLRVETERTVESEREQLRRVVENLLRNAVEHGTPDSTAPDASDSADSETDDEREHPRSDADGVTVTVGDLEDGFFVADDGPGIPKDERERVFERGYTTRSEGTGFGLTIVERIVEAHGWSIEVTESESGGARFEVHTE